MTQPLPADPNRRAEADAGERARVAAGALALVNGPLELHAAVLALMLPAGSQRALRAWEIECERVPGAQTLRAHVGALPGAARLPWFENLLARLRSQPLGVRQSLLEATRRLMGARGVVRPIDRLHWVAMRQRLGEVLPVSAPAAAATSVSELPRSDVRAIAMFTAFLSRMVPVDAADAPGDATANPGAAWYDSVMATWQGQGITPMLEAPDTDGLMHALGELQALAWMQRPVLARTWVAAALQHSRYARLADGAADALRLSCALLDSPLPPELARHYHATHLEPAP